MPARCSPHPVRHLVGATESTGRPLVTEIRRSIRTLTIMRLRYPHVTLPRDRWLGRGVCLSIVQRQPRFTGLRCSASRRRNHWYAPPPLPQIPPLPQFFEVESAIRQISGPEATPPTAPDRSRTRSIRELSPPSATFAPIPTAVRTGAGFTGPPAGVHVSKNAALIQPK